MLFLDFHLGPKTQQHSLAQSALREMFNSLSKMAPKPTIHRHFFFFSQRRLRDKVKSFPLFAVFDVALLSVFTEELDWVAVTYDEQICLYAVYICWWATLIWDFHIMKSTNIIQSQKQALSARMFPLTTNPTIPTASQLEEDEKLNTVTLVRAARSNRHAT